MIAKRDFPIYKPKINHWLSLAKPNHINHINQIGQNKNGKVRQALPKIFLAQDGAVCCLGLFYEGTWKVIIQNPLEYFIKCGIQN